MKGNRFTFEGKKKEFHFEFNKNIIRLSSVSCTFSWILLIVAGVIGR